MAEAEASVLQTVWGASLACDDGPDMYSDLRFRFPSLPVVSRPCPTSCGPDAARESAALRESESDALTQGRKRTRIPRFFERAIDRTRISPVEVTTDRYRVYPRVLDELLPAAFHDTEVHANNPLETDHGRLKVRLRPMRGLKRDRTARVIVAGHALA